MLENKHGVIVNMASMAHRRGGPGSSIHYAAAKGAVVSMTMGVAREFAAQGIRALSISPGPIKTPFQDAAQSSPELVKRFLDDVPMKRFGEPEEIGELVLFLCSDACPFMTADTVYVERRRRLALIGLLRGSGEGKLCCAAAWWKGPRPRGCAGVLDSRWRSSLFCNGNEASSQRPPPPRFAWSPSPALRAGADKRKRSRDAFASEVCARFVARMEPTGPARSGRPDDKLRVIRGRVDTARSFPDCAALHPGYKNKGSGAPTGAPRCPHHRMRARALRPRSPPPRAGEVGRGRARLSALHRGSRQGFYPLAQPRPRFLCAGSVPCWAPRASVQRAPRGPVVMPDGRSSEPPGSGVTSPARERRTCSIQRPSPVDVPH